MYILLLEGVGKAIIEAMRTMFGYLASVIYDFIVLLYDLFIYLSRMEILDNDFVQSIYKKVGSILLLFMVFKLTFSLINSLINPDKFNDKKNGFTAIITRSILAIVMLGITPTIFREMFDLQSLIIGANNSSDNVLYKLVLSDAIVSDSTSFGKTLASNLFFCFYTDDEYPKFGGETIPNASGELVTLNVKTLKESIESDDNETFFTAIQYINEKGSTGDYAIEFDIVFSVLVGAFVVWILVMYCIQAAVRVFQLAYLQLIAPVPILSYISEPEGAFKKWISQCVNTFLDLFIRLLIIYFILYLCDYITKNIDNIISFDMGAYNISDKMENWLYIFLIVGLLLFAKKVPELLKDIFPMKGGAGKFSYGLKPAKEISDFAKGATTFGAGAVVGAVGGVATGIKYGDGVKGKIFGAFGGLGRGALGGMKTKGNIIGNARKGMGAQRAAAQRAYDRNHDGSDFWGRTFGAHSASLRAEVFEDELKAYDDYKSKFDFVEKELEKNANVQFARAQLEQLRQSSTVTEGVTVNGKPVIDKRTGKQVMRTRAVTSADFAKANARIKAAQDAALVDEISKGNGKILTAINEADIIRSKGRQKGYSGFSDKSLTVGSATDIANAFKSNKDDARKATDSIKSIAGAKYDEYTSAKANAKYDKKPK